MARKTTLNAANLEALGAERLAGLLMELAGGDAAIKRRLRLELAGNQGPGEIAREIRKRLAAIARSRSFLERGRLRPLVNDLQTQRRAITGPLAASDPPAALDLMWRFLALADPTLGRCDDSDGAVSAVFEEAVADLARIAPAASPDPRRLADETFTALGSDGYGVFHGLIRALAPALGTEGLAHIEQRMTALSREPVPTPPEEEREVIAWGTHGVIYADEIERRARENTVSRALAEIADRRGDVDGFIAQYDEKMRSLPEIAAGIARRLVAAGRPGDALEAIEAATRPDRGFRREVWEMNGAEVELEDARIEVLEALGRTDDAQAVRWSCFERFLSASHLRAHLQRLPDFDDVEAERRALETVERLESLVGALAFLTGWPALDRAAALLLRRADELDGDWYEILTPAAEALAGRHPLAATLLLRSMIDFALQRKRSARYRHAARHLESCRGLASFIGDFGDFEPHEAYVARLQAEHGRKYSFWEEVAENAAGG
ncbi:hypothetical protein SH611_13825 [Geminicoccaceae bacterium 1502E]|nr:hypothetical protein [Geminicoccaceae bacterium 1502E]